MKRDTRVIMDIHTVPDLYMLTPVLYPVNDIKKLNFKKSVIIADY